MVVSSLVYYVIGGCKADGAIFGGPESFYKLLLAVKEAFRFLFAIFGEGDYHVLEI